MKILNLYAGIGGNRKLWNDCDITAIENDPAIAEIYQKLYPGDVVVCTDAKKFLEQFYYKFDFIWSSPPCPSHGQYRHNVGVIGKGFKPVMPDMGLYAEIIFLSTYFKGKYVVENVKPYYKYLIDPTFELQRHVFWSNFNVLPKLFPSTKVRSKNKLSDFDDFKIVRDSKIKNKRQVLRNCVLPEIGKYIFDCAFKEQPNDRQIP